jgi:1,4-alpha-glucan branching enzyme
MKPAVWIPLALCLALPARGSDYRSVYPDHDPFAYPAWGATEHPDGTVTFALHAPGKQSVALVADFNDWDGAAHPMTNDALGTWSITVPLEPGRYLYQYRIDDTRVIADPYARDVLWQDGAGKETWRPERAFTVLDVGAAPFVWTATNYVRPSLDQLIVYEFHLEDFLGAAGGFTGMIERLDYIADLGFTAIGPMPFHEFPHAKSWGYNPAYHFAPETVYGTPDELKQLIDAAHQRGLAVIMDLVLNHMDHNSALYQLYGDDYDNSPFFHKFEGENWGFPDLDQPHPAVKRYAADVIRYWLSEYKIDGIRYDATRFTDWSGYNDWGAGWFAWVGREADPTSIHIAEHMPSDPELINRTELDTTWHDYFRWRLRDMIENAWLDRNEEENILQPRRIGFTNGLQRMAYTESHDEERVMNLLKQKGFPEEERTRRAVLALALTLTAPGTAMIYSGQEFGEFTTKVVGENPLQWDLLDTPVGQELFEATRRLTRLRAAHPALRHGDLTFLHQGQPEGMTAFRRDAAENEAVLVAANFSRGANTMELTFAGSWTNLLTGAAIEDTGEFTRSLALQPGEVSVWVRHP